MPNCQPLFVQWEAVQRFGIHRHIFHSAIPVIPARLIGYTVGAGRIDLVSQRGGKQMVVVGCPQHVMKVGLQTGGKTLVNGVVGIQHTSVGELAPPRRTGNGPLVNLPVLQNGRIVRLFAVPGRLQRRAARIRGSSRQVEDILQRIIQVEAGNHRVARILIGRVFYLVQYIVIVLFVLFSFANAVGFFLVKIQ